MGEHENETLGKRILRFIKESGHSQSGFGRELGFSRQLVGHWVSDRNKPSIQDLRKISAFLKVPLDVLTGSEPELHDPADFSQAYAAVSRAKAAIDIALSAMERQARAFGVPLEPVAGDGGRGDSRPALYEQADGEGEGPIGDVLDGPELPERVREERLKVKPGFPNRRPQEQSEAGEGT